MRCFVGTRRGGRASRLGCLTTGAGAAGGEVACDDATVAGSPDTGGAACFGRGCGALGFVRFGATPAEAPTDVALGKRESFTLAGLTLFCSSSCRSAPPPPQLAIMPSISCVAAPPLPLLPLTDRV